MRGLYCRRVLVIVSLVVACGISRPLVAQHHHHGGHHSSHHAGGHGTSHYGGHHGSTHYGGGHSSYRHGGYHSGWAHVVPSHYGHTGLYYSCGGANYYTPVVPQVTVQALRPQPLASAAGTSLPGEEIAPQSIKLEFGNFKRSADLAARFEIETNRWCLDLHYNYRQNANFAAVYRDAYKVLTAARYMNKADHRQDWEAIRSELATVEPLFHQVQEAIKAWKREEKRPIGEGDIAAKTEVVEGILHHLLFDAGVETSHPSTTEEQAPEPEEAIPPPEPAN